MHVPLRCWYSEATLTRLRGALVWRCKQQLRITFAQLNWDPRHLQLTLIKGFTTNCEGFGSWWFRELQAGAGYGKFVLGVKGFVAPRFVCEDGFRHECGGWECGHKGCAVLEDGCDQLPQGSSAFTGLSDSSRRVRIRSSLLPLFPFSSQNCLVCASGSWFDVDLLVLRFWLLWWDCKICPCHVVRETNLGVLLNFASVSIHNFLQVRGKLKLTLDFCHLRVALELL